MVTTALLGVPMAMLQNVVYATPVRSATGFVFPMTAVLEASDEEGGPFTAISNGEGQVYTSAPFIRCTDAIGCTILFKV